MSMRYSALVLVASSSLLVPGRIVSAANADELPLHVTVATEEEEAPLIAKLVQEVAKHPGLSPKDADRLFDPLRQEIDRQRDAGKAAELYPRSLLHIISTGLAHHYEVDQIGVILAKGHKAMGRGKSASSVEEIIVRGFMKRLQPTDIYDQLKP